MSVTINAKGTSTTSFKVGKNGTIITEGGVISPPAATDLKIDLDVGQNLVVDAGISGPALITATANQDLHINPAVGGGQYLILNSSRWPTVTGIVGQVLTTDGSGILSWVTPATAPAIDIVPETSQAALANYQYVITNTASVTTITLPSAPLDGDIIWVMNATSRIDHIIARNGQILQGLSEDMIINQANINIQLRFINTTIGWRML